MNIDLTQLNDEQRLPATETEGAVLVTAGAGSGKTRLLTYRIGHLIADLGVAPYNILAITFTNKAAGEMKSRLAAMGCDDSIWVFTFHALCGRMLRKYAPSVGFTSNFTIYGEAEKLSVIKKILKEKNVEDKDDLSPSSVGNAISDAKNAGLDADEYAKINKFRKNAEVISSVFFEYGKALKQNNAMDYDDMLILALKLLKTNDEAREYYQNKFRYIHIDEFQDTNEVQYDIVRILSGKWGNIFAVGDEDQSIYGWRGANYKNIFRFQKDFAGVKTFKLERNYRSTKKIVSLANKVIKNNTQRMDKSLWTANDEGSPVTYYCAKSDREEVDYVVSVMNRLVQQGYSLSDFAVLMRINAITRPFEERFLQYGIAHKVFGGFKFFERAEIKNVLAYLKVLDNHADEESLLRIVNFPKRGIGEASVKQIVNYARLENKTVFDVILSVDQNEELPLSLVKKFRPLSVVFQCLENAVREGRSPSYIAKYLCKVADIKAAYGEDSEENAERKMNIRELVSAMEEYEQENPEATLSEYLQTVSLYSDTDEMSDDGYVTLATVHSVKGLEFRVVFMVGMEEGIFPSSRCVEEADKLEEERRLFYVAITRAEEKLYLTRAQSRFRFGTTDLCMRSRFLEEAGFGDATKKDGGSPKYGVSSEGRSGYAGVRYERAYSKASAGYNVDEVPLSDGSSTGQSRIKTKMDYSAYKVGVKVRHKKFGDGVITKVEQKSGVVVGVRFPTIGELVLMLEYAPLEILEG